MTTTRCTVPACWTWTRPSEASQARMVGTILRDFRSVVPFGPMPYPDRDYLRDAIDAVKVLNGEPSYIG